MNNTIELKTLRARNVATGVWKEWPVDEVLVNGARVALVHHVEKAPLCLLRVLSDPTIRTIHEDVRRLRGEQGKPTIADVVSRLPDPEQLKKSMKLKAGSR
jgi:hypothetical protein